MKYFRHPPLLLWTVICALMGALLVVGLSTGRDAEPLQGIPDRRVATADVYSLTSRMTDINRVAGSTALPEWSKETARLADEAAERRLRQGASTGDGLVQAFRTMAEDARNLSEVDLDDVMAVRTGVALLQADADALGAIISGANPAAVIPMPGEETPGLPSPETPALPEAPGTPDNGAGDIPAVPAIPVQPAQPGTPNAPVIPVPGAAAAVPQTDQPHGGTR